MRECASINQKCKTLFLCLKEWFYHARSVERDWLFVLHVECMLDLVQRGVTAGLIASEAAASAVSFIKASDALRGSWAAAFQPQRRMCLNEYTSCGAEAEVRAWKRDNKLSRATTLSQLFHHGRGLMVRRAHTEFAEADSKLFKKSNRELGAFPHAIRTAFAVCTPRVAKLLERQFTMAAKMECTCVSATEMMVTSADGFYDDDEYDIFQRPPPRHIIGGQKANDVFAKLAGVESHAYTEGEVMRGLRFARRPGASARSPWRFYDLHRVARIGAGSVVLVGDRLLCRAAGGLPCAFTREFGAHFLIF